MGKRTIVLVVALALAAVSAFSIWQYLSGVEGDLREGLREVRVYRAAQFIPAGTAGETLTIPDFIEEGTALAEDVAFEGSTILCFGVVDPGDDQTLCDNNPQNLQAALEARLTAGPISAKQLITSEMFVTLSEASVSLSESIPAGKVAISIRPEEEASVGGFIRPGDRVNLLASASVELTQLVELFQDAELRELVFGGGLGQTQGEQGEGEVDETGQPVDPLAAFADTIPNSLQFTQTVLQDLEVLAVGPDTRDAPLGVGLEPQGAQVVVLEVTPEQAEKIEFARQYTSVAFSLLPKDEPYTEFEAQGVLVDDLFALLDRIEEQLRLLGESLGN
ncbi:MAG TPA: Flp pilus assembly protein CpaB [Acidimicrobiia bacterium]|jgi:Flp pilus assembly protein CpaB